VLKWIVGNKTDHPLADIREVRGLIADLPTADSVKALGDITYWLESLSGADGFKLDRLLEVIDLLDLAAKAHHRKLVQDYLAMQRQQKLQENRLWTAGFKFTKALGEVYLYAVRQHASGAPGAAAVKKQLPVMAARGIRALAQQIKWIMLRYGPFEPRLWASIGELYQHAESGAFTTTPLVIYPGEQGSGSVELEYVKAIMLWASSADVLSPVKQDIAERTVAYVASAFHLAKEPFPGAIYCFDPARDRRPLRMLGEPISGDNVYYLSPGDAGARLSRIIPVLEKSGTLPVDVNLGATYMGEMVLSVFKHLCLYWSDKPPTRLSERRQTTARITVVPGYFQLLDELEREDMNALDFSVPNAESWVVEDVSDNGYGAVVPEATTDWVRVGELIGLQVEGAQLWGVALVRRVTRDEERHYRVGIEVISRAVHVVRISHGGREPELAVLLSNSPDSNGEIGLLLRAGRFNAGTNSEMTIKDVKYTVAPTRMVDAGNDFDWAMYKVIRPL
jgi:cyclic-di-GMP-binding protein